MLDMGFYDDIMQVVKLLPVETRQTLMFSATMPPKIRDLAKTILRDPAEISIAIAKPAEGIRQAAYPVYETQKGRLVMEILRGHKGMSTIIFGSRKQSVKELGHALRHNHFNAGVIHSDLEQSEREEVLRQFRNRNIEVLVATDIIARGIDIPDVDVVVNFDVPRDAEDYVHRIGRTARAQSKGEAFTLIVPDEMMAFGRIEKLIEQTVEKLPLPDGLGEQPEYDPNLRSRGGRGGKGAPRAQQGRQGGKSQSQGGGGRRKEQRKQRPAKPEQRQDNATRPEQPQQQPAAQQGETPRKKRHKRHTRKPQGGDNAQGGGEARQEQGGGGEAPKE